MTRGLSDIEALARKYDPNWVDPPIMDLRPSYKPTGNLRQDIYNLIVSRREDNLVAIGRTLGVSDWIVSQHVQRFVREGVFSQDEIYQRLPKIREAHERRARKQQRQQQK